MKEKGKFSKIQILYRDNGKYGECHGDTSEKKQNQEYEKYIENGTININMFVEKQKP